MSMLKRLWESEPVRVALYPLLAALLAYLVVAGKLDVNAAMFISAAVAAALGVPAIEIARSKVTPQAKVTQENHIVDGALEHIGEQVGRAIQNASLSPEVRIALERARTTAENVIGRHRLGG